MSDLPRLPSFDLTSHRCRVKGAERGIGLALAARWAEAGGHDVLAARTEAEIKAAGKAISARGDSAAYLVLDAGDIEATSAAIAEHGPFDVLVNKAGPNRPKPMTDVPVDDYDTVLRVNLKSAFFVAQAVAQELIKLGKPRPLIHMPSQMGHVGGPKRSLNCSVPTFIETPMTKPFFEDEDSLKSTLAKIKLRRLGQVEDLMGAVLYLASAASALLTGTSLVVYGGWTAD